VRQLRAQGTALHALTAADVFGLDGEAEGLGHGGGRDTEDLGDDPAVGVVGDGLHAPGVELDLRLEPAEGVETLGVGLKRGIVVAQRTGDTDGGSTEVVLIGAAGDLGHQLYALAVEGRVREAAQQELLRFGDVASGELGRYVRVEQQLQRLLVIRDLFEKLGHRIRGPLRLLELVAVDGHGEARGFGPTLGAVALTHEALEDLGRLIPVAYPRGRARQALANLVGG